MKLGKKTYEKVIWLPISLSELPFLILSAVMNAAASCSCPVGRLGDRIKRCAARTTEFAVVYRATASFPVRDRSNCWCDGRCDRTRFPVHSRIDAIIDCN